MVRSVCTLRFVPLMAFVMLAGFASEARADWVANVPHGFHLAQSQGRMAVVFMRMDERRGRHRKGNTLDNNRNNIVNAFNDPRVKAITSRSFTLIQGDYKNKELRKKFPAARELDIFICTPEGEVYEHIRKLNAAKPEVLIEKLSSALSRYHRHLYERDLQPILQDADARPADLRKALVSLSRAPLDSADQDVIRLLRRPSLDLNVRRAGFQTLAAISTRDAILALLEHAVDDKAVFDILKKCDRRAAGYLAAELNAGRTPRVMTAYKAACTILKTSMRNDDLLQRDAELATKEFSRVRDLAGK